LVDRQQLDLLRQGWDVWNAWRKQHTEIHPDLSEADLSYGDLRGADLRGTDLSDADLRSTDLRNSNLSHADLRDADLSYARITGANLGSAKLNEAVLSRADLSYADLSNADLIGATLNEAILGRATLRDADLTGANLSRANLMRAQFSNANLSGARLALVHLRNAHLGGANLMDADLTGANLSIAYCGNAHFNHADLSDADFSGAGLRAADLSDANLCGTNFSGADLRDAEISRAKVGWTQFDNVDLRTVKGLEAVEHRDPSTLGIDTIYRSAGHIPEIFLRRAGVPEDFIISMRSLMTHPVEYYTCFIGYAREDQDFAERLYADLQRNGVHCWFAPEDLQIGENFWHSVDESIRLYDKLLLVLSEHAVNSEWAEREVMAALEKEQQQNTLVLFPIALDKLVKQTNLPWAVAIRHTRHIGDFSRWKDQNAYQQALGRLLLDLQSHDQPKRSTERDEP
ncbi:MAG TPA: toll/interleukin-1 receptor domain-containing protein, partial [Ktedonobacteraceae bacterium]|nr:toll/interleukin-1 receptor domain-containing protein [Ktedonobacteraceae bacterium]